MKILVVGDLHLKPSQFSMAEKVLAWIRSSIEEIRPDMVVYLGDTFDTHSVIRAEIQGIFDDHLAKTLSPLIETIHLVGNHDQWKPTSSEYHALRVFKSRRHLKIIEKPEYHMGLFFVPYIHEASLFPKSSAQIAFAHQTFLGASYNSFRPKDGVNTSDVGAEIIISGHIHGRQMFDNVIYPGTPYASSLSDVDQDKGLMLFDSDTYSYSFIDSPFPRYRSIEIREDDALPLDINSRDKYIIKLIGSKVFCSSFLSSKIGRDLIGIGASIRPQYTDSIKNQRISIKKQSIKDMAVEYIDKVLRPNDPGDILKELEALYE